eukprot:symbB.v1.2.020622.t1/scaffold1747.1/size103332/9
MMLALSGAEAFVAPRVPVTVVAPQRTRMSGESTARQSAATWSSIASCAGLLVAGFVRSSRRQTPPTTMFFKQKFGGPKKKDCSFGLNILGTELRPVVFPGPRCTVWPTVSWLQGSRRHSTQLALGFSQSRQAASDPKAQWRFLGVQKEYDEKPYDAAHSIGSD